MPALCWRATGAGDPSAGGNLSDRPASQHLSSNPSVCADGPAHAWLPLPAYCQGEQLICLEVGLIDLLIFSVGAAHGCEKLRAMGEAQDRGHGPLLHFNQLNPPPSLG